jgi:hypothetical protein
LGTGVGQLQNIGVDIAVAEPLRHRDISHFTA